MRCRNRRLVLVGIALGMAMSCLTPPAQATVYGWKGEGGVWHLSNDLESVPEAHRSVARKFTSKFAGRSAVISTEIVSAPEPEATPVRLQTSAYERGLEQGLRTAERQVALAGELARNVLAALPRTPPPRIVIQQPGPIMIREIASDYYPPPFYDFLGPSVPFNGRFSYGRGYPYGFRRLVPHSHFFPGSRRGLRARRAGLFSSPTFRARHGEIFFPHGHSSHHGFLFGHGFVVR